MRRSLVRFGQWAICGVMFLSFLNWKIVVVLCPYSYSLRHSYRQRCRRFSAPVHRLEARLGIKLVNLLGEMLARFENATLELTADILCQSFVAYWPSEGLLILALIDKIRQSRSYLTAQVTVLDQSYASDCQHRLSIGMS